MKLIADRKNERAFLGGTLFTGNTSYLAKCDELDFVCERFLFVELRGMLENEEPLDDPVSLARWFTADAAIDRAKAEGIAELAFYVGQVATETTTGAHLAYHFRCLRKDRTARALQLFGYRLIERVEADRADSLKVFSWGRDQFDELWELADEANAEGTL